MQITKNYHLVLYYQPIVQSAQREAAIEYTGWELPPPTYVLYIDGIVVLMVRITTTVPLKTVVFLWTVHHILFLGGVVSYESNRQRIMWCGFR